MSVRFIALIVCSGMCVHLCFHVLVCQQDRVPICSGMRAPLRLWAIVSTHVCWLQSVSGVFYPCVQGVTSPLRHSPLLVQHVNIYSPPSPPTPSLLS